MIVNTGPAYPLASDRAVSVYLTNQIVPLKQVICLLVLADRARRLDGATFVRLAVHGEKGL